VELSNDASMKQPIDTLLISPSFVSTKMNGTPVIPGIIPAPLDAAKSYLADCGRFSYTQGPLFAKLLCKLTELGWKLIPGLLNFIFYHVGKQDFIDKKKKKQK